MDKMDRTNIFAVIGLEVHAQPLTKARLTTPTPRSMAALPNTNVGVVTLAHPGTLPRLNKRVVEYAIKMGLACHTDNYTIQYLRP